MSRRRDHRRATAILVAACLLVTVVAYGVHILDTWGIFRGPAGAGPAQNGAVDAAATGSPETSRERDTALVRRLMDEDLAHRRFDFGTVISAASGKQVVPLDPNRPAHRRVVEAIKASLARSTEVLSRDDSPVREHRRINEVSSHFEEALRLDLDAVDGLRCEVPKNREGRRQRSGYPDLRVVDEARGEVFYLDPKLVENGSWDSSFRSFYFEPKKGSLKINDDAVHLLVGIGHDGNSGAWTFGPWKIVDLSTITLRLKPEFQASNRDLYPPHP